MNLIDTHCHVTFGSPCSFQISYPTLDVDVDLSHLHGYSPQSSYHYIGVGLHPWFVTSALFQQLQAIPLDEWKTKAHFIGEIGLDHSPRFHDNWDLQQAAFHYQLEVAARLSKPVSLHLVKAYQPMYSLLKSTQVRGAIHGFSGSVVEAKRFYELGFRLGLNAMILRANTPRYQALIKSLPLDAFVLETDFPNIAYPDGRQADQHQLLCVAEKVAQLKQVSLQQVVCSTTQNAIESFNFVTA